MRFHTEDPDHSELLSSGWMLSDKYYMNVLVLTMCKTHGLSILGTNKLKRFMTILGTMFEKRIYDTEFYADTKMVATYNDFRFTSMQNEIEIIKDKALYLAKFIDTHVLVIIANDEGRKFIFISDKIKMQVAASELSPWIALDLLTYESDAEIDK